jgi:hypothetical protein
MVYDSVNTHIPYFSALWVRNWATHHPSKMEVLVYFDLGQGCALIAGRLKLEE